MNFKPLAAAFVLTALLCPVLPAHAAVSQQTTDFVQKASEGNLFEIESSKIALQKTSAKDVKDFAQRMVADHTQIGDQLKKALNDSGTGLTPATVLDNDHQNTINSLNAAAPTTFDNLYAQAQVKAHDEAVNLFTGYAQNGDDAVLKKFASNTLPMLKEHQALAHTLSQSYVSARQ